MRPADPRIRQTLNQISQNLESANLATQASLFSVYERYINPCLASVATCLENSCQPCYACLTAWREPRSRNTPRPRRGRDNFGFDFYDDWDEDEGDWGNDELDRLLAGPAEVGQQPARNQKMNYGSRLGRRGILPPKRGELDPNVVPKSSVFGFLESLPWKIGGRGRRYRPSAADLQEHVGGGRFEEAEPLMEESEESGIDGKRNHGRKRSDTLASKSTTASLSSRGDLFTSEGEDDAVLLDDDEFAMALERRNTGTLSDDRSSKKARRKGSRRSHNSTETASSREAKKVGQEEGIASAPKSEAEGVRLLVEDTVLSLHDLKREEEQAEQDEEEGVKNDRQAAMQAARERGLMDTVGDDGRYLDKSNAGSARERVIKTEPGTSKLSQQTGGDIPKEPE